MRVFLICMLDHAEEIVAKALPPPSHRIFPPPGDHRGFFGIFCLLPGKRVARDLRVQGMLIAAYAANPTGGRDRAGLRSSRVVQALRSINRHPGDNFRGFGGRYVRARFTIPSTFFENTRRVCPATASGPATAAIAFSVYELRSGHTFKMQTRVAKNKIREQIAKRRKI